MSPGTRSASLALALGAALLLGCAPELERVSELNTLRVLGVQKDNPYAFPGEDVTLSLLWHDGSPDGPRDDILRAWIPFPQADGSLAPVCINPPADSYAGCFEQLQGLGQGAPIPNEPFEVPLPEGDEVTLTIPSTILTEDAQGNPRPPPPPGSPRYGIAYAFFAVCAGDRFVFDPSVQGIPLLCVDANGTPLSSNDFVAGYTAIYSFDDITNENPVISGFEFREEPVTPDCIGAACIDLPIAEVDCSQPGAPCVPACPEDGEQGCTPYPLQAVVDQFASVETDDLAALAYGGDFSEQLWANYYVSGGSVSNDVKLVNDATTGWNTEQTTNFRAPKDPGAVAVWSLVHDNRGGVEFVRFTIGVQ